MTPEESAEPLHREFGDAIQDIVLFRGQATVAVARDRIVDIARYCRDDLGYNFLSDVTGVDWLDRTPRFDVVYVLTSLKYWNRLVLKVLVDEGESIPTVIPIWGAANWGEREVWDMFGVEFEGHPNLQRLLLPEGWIGHPLRKDFRQTQIALPRPRADKVPQGNELGDKYGPE